MFRKISCIRFDGEKYETISHDVVEEIPMALFVNGRHAMTAMMSPSGLEDFVTGYLFTEEIIKGPEEIESIKVEKNRVSVLTTNPFKSIGTKKTILSGCGGSVSYIDTEKLPKVRSDFTITPAELVGAVQSVLTSDLSAATEGVHIAGLLDREKAITVAEDIYRHNALDRVIGYGLRKGIDFSRTYVVLSGRISSEMVRKCLVANIPLIVSRGATTSLAVETAEKTGLTVVGFAREGKMNIYSHPRRVEGADKKTE